MRSTVRSFTLTISLIFLLSFSFSAMSAGVPGTEETAESAGVDAGMKDVAGPPGEPARVAEVTIEDTGVSVEETAVDLSPEEESNALPDSGEKKPEGALDKIADEVKEDWREDQRNIDAPGTEQDFQRDISEAGREAAEAVHDQPYSADVEKKEIEYEERESASGAPMGDRFPVGPPEKAPPAGELIKEIPPTLEKDLKKLEEELPPGFEKKVEALEEESISEAEEEGDEKQLPIVADADSVEFDREQNVITGTGNAVVRYEEAKLSADKITVYLETGDAFAEGNVSLVQEGEFLTGKNIRYNFKTGEGNITDCHAYVQPWYGYGKTVRRISKDEYQIENGYVTTCDYTKPHTSFRAKKIYIYPGDSVVAHNVAFYLYDNPVFWAPYTKYSLVDDETPYNIVPGFNSDWGFFLLSSIDVYKTKYLSITPQLDYRTKRGFGIGLIGDYDLPTAKAYGEARFYWTHDNDPQYTLNSDLARTDRYRITWEHGQELTENTQMTVKINKQSDEDFIEEFFRDEFEDYIQRENYVDITMAKEAYQLTFRVEPRLNNFYTVIQRLPEFKVETVDQRIGETPFFYKSTNSVVNFDYEFSDDPLDADEAEQGLPEPPIPSDIQTWRVDTAHEFSLPKKYFKFLNVKPFVGFRQTFYHEAPTGPPGYEGTGVFIDTDEDGIDETEQLALVRAPEDENVWRGYLNTGFQSDMKVWRVWDYYNKKLKINRLRHIFQPSLDYQLFTEPTRTFADEVYDFDEVDFFNELSMFTLGLRNALQTQRGEGEDVDIFDIKIYLDMVTNVGKYRRPGPAGFESRQFADDNYSIAEVRDGFNKFFNDVFIDAEFRPIEWCKLDFEIYWRLDPNRLDEWNTDFYIYQSDVVSWAVGQRYLVDDSNLWSTEFNIQLNDNWAARTFMRFETADGTFEEGEWSLFRDLHEWEAAVTVRYRGRKKSEIGMFVLLYLDSYPDIPLEVSF